MLVWMYLFSRTRTQLLWSDVCGFAFFHQRIGVEGQVGCAAFGAQGRSHIVNHPKSDFFFERHSLDSVSYFLSHLGLIS